MQVVIAPLVVDNLAAPDFEPGAEEVQRCFAVRGEPGAMRSGIE